MRTGINALLGDGVAPCRFARAPAMPDLETGSFRYGAAWMVTAAGVRAGLASVRGAPGGPLGPM